MRLVAVLFAATCMSGQQAAGNVWDLEWASGAGLQSCSRLDQMNDEDFVPWVKGYWTGVNLYLGGSDLCRERANLSGLSSADIRAVLRIYCSEIPGRPIMFAAFNALKSLPTIPGTRAAKCRKVQ